MVSSIDDRRQEPAPQKKSHSKLGWVIFAAIVAAIISFLFGCAAPVAAQTPAAPGVRIADVAMPTNVVITAFVTCLGDKPTKDREKRCERLAEREARRSEKVANEAADAAQAARPIVVDSPYGYGYGRRSYGGYYGCRWPYCG